MSCGKPHETDCAEVIARVYEYLDGEMPEGDCGKIKQHLHECGPCLKEYGIEDEVKKLVKRSCSDPGSGRPPSEGSGQARGRPRQRRLTLRPSRPSQHMTRPRPLRPGSLSFRC
jgi:anti-sigma factor (TIGR02949 family)